MGWDVLRRRKSSAAAWEFATMVWRDFSKAVKRAAIEAEVLLAVNGSCCSEASSSSESPCSRKWRRCNRCSKAKSVVSAVFCIVLWLPMLVDELNGRVERGCWLLVQCSIATGD